MITGYVGPMWSGKTTRLLEYATGGSSEYCAIEPVFNTRGSVRDLGKNVAAVRLRDKGQVLPERKIYVFDEVHLYEAFNASDVLLQHFHALRRAGKDIVFAGVYFDCYRNFQPFPIYNHIFPHCDSVQFCKSFRPCGGCGGPEAIYTQARKTAGGNSGCVGDHYHNLCLPCLQADRGQSEVG